MRRLAILLTVLLGASSACVGAGTPATGGTETGNTAAIAIRVIGYQSSQAALAVGDLQVDTARVVLDELRFRPFSACDSASDSEGAQDVQFNGPFVADLLNSSPLNGLEDLTVESGLYCRIELTMKKLEEPLPSGVSPSDPIVGKSLYVTGSRSDGTPFQMSQDFDENFVIENSATGFQIQASDIEKIFFIAFNIDRWFNGVDLNGEHVEISADGSGNTVIYIDGTHNSEIQQQIRDNIKLSSGLFEDSNNDDALNPEEEDHPLAAGI